MSQTAYIWVVIGLASAVAGTLRLLPALVEQVNRLHDYPKIIKFLDYTICMITGEIVYSMAFGDMPQGSHYMILLALTTSAMALGIAIMHYTDCLTKSFLYSLLYFVIALCFVPL